MQITTIRNILLASVAVGALAACETTTNASSTGGSTGGSTGSDFSADDVTHGTSSSEASSNGLRFANGDDYLNDDDLAPREPWCDDGWHDHAPNCLTVDDNKLTLTVRGARLDAIRTKDLDPNNLTFTVGAVELVVTQVWYAGGDLIVAIDFGNGETALFNANDDWDEPILSSDGWSYSYDIINLSHIDSARVIEYRDDFGDDDGHYYTRMYAVAGFETDPIWIDHKLDADYTGSYQSYIGISGDDPDNQPPFPDEFGIIKISAEFGEGVISGEMYDGDIDVEFDGIISGNGWVAVAAPGEDQEIFGDEITGGGGVQLDGVFYSLLGEETAGTMMIDADLIDDEDDDEEYSVTGVGYFSADQDEL